MQSRTTKHLFWFWREYFANIFNKSSLRDRYVVSVYGHVYVKVGKKSNMHINEVVVNRFDALMIIDYEWN